MAEKNPLVLSGEYERVYVCELEAGDITVFGETVESVHRKDDSITYVYLTNGDMQVYGDGLSTILIKA